MNTTNDNDLLLTIVEAIQDRKGQDITLIDLTRLHVSNAQHFVIAQGGSPTQVSAIADSVRELVQQKLGIKPVNYTGYTNSTWIVIDYGYVMVHIFMPDARRFYDIETLWADGEFTEIPNI